jgi:hypothetical protein
LPIGYPGRRRTWPVGGSALDADTAARLFVAASDGLQAQSPLDPSIDPEADLTRLTALLCAAVTPG